MFFQMGEGNLTQERSPPRRRSDWSRASTAGAADPLPSSRPSLAAAAAADPDKLLSAGRSSQMTRSSDRFSSICRCTLYMAECGVGGVSAPFQQAFQSLHYCRPAPRQPQTRTCRGLDTSTSTATTSPATQVPIVLAPPGSRIAPASSHVLW